MTYQEKINSYSSFESQLLFEMEHTGGRDIEEMLSWNYENTSFLELKYEHLMQDTDLVIFHRTFTFLGFPGATIPGLLQIAYDNSLFSGFKSAHARSGNSNQWQEHFTPRVKSRFQELFGDAVERLGYEGGADW